MNMNTFRSLLTGLFLLLAASLQAAPPPLDRIISVSIQNERLGSALNIISRAGNFTFSYNSALINENTLVSVRASNAAVRSVLTQLFRGTVTYKSRGNHVILLRADLPGEEPKSFILDGYILDRQTGSRIAQASIYEKTTLASTVSNPYGYYRLKIPAEQASVKLEVRKKYYYGESVTVNGRRSQSVDIRLAASPLKEAPSRTMTVRMVADTVRPLVATPPVSVTVATDTTMTTRVTDWERTKEDLRRSKEEFMDWLLTKKQAIHEANLSGDTLYRDFQVSLVPFVGTNHTLSGRVINRYSFNILAGYSLGVSALELGGFLNVVQGNVTGLQLSGFSNIVAGNTSGVQAAGFVNVNRLNNFGVQAAGFGNAVGGSVEGVQAAGFFNYVAQNANRGIQAAGFMNVVGQDAQALQAAGFINVVKNRVQGLQIAGFGNVVGQEMRGWQIAGFLNAVGGHLHGNQISGFLNVAGTVTGGRQIGLINVAKDSEKAPIGLLSFVRDGYLRLEASTDEVNAGNLTLKTGHRKFYNILTIGTNFNRPGYTNLSLGYGLGRAFDFGRGWMLNTDLIGLYHFPRDRRYDDGHTHIRLIPAIERRLAKGIYLAAGPTFNAFFTTRSTDKPTTRIDVPLFDTQFTSRNNRWDGWIGFQGAVRIGL